MKKVFIFIILLFLVGCSSLEKDDDIKILVPNGVTFIALGDLIGDDDLSIENVSGVNILTSALISSSHDIIIAPLNVGVKLYNTNATKYKLVSIITLGNSYIASRKTNSLNSLTDLNSHELMAYGKGSIPDITLQRALNINNITPNITYQNTVDLIVPFFICNTNDPNDLSCNPPEYIMTTEPILTKMIVKYNLDLNVLDLQEVIKDDVSLYPQAAIFVNPELLNTSSLNQSLNKIKQNIEYLNQNPDNYANKIVNKHQYFKELSEEVISSSIPRSKIQYISAKDNKDDIIEYLEFINNNNPAMIGNKIPSNDIYN